MECHRKTLDSSDDVELGFVLDQDVSSVGVLRRGSMVDAVLFQLHS